jgi:hypothetical protein
VGPGYATLVAIISRRISLPQRRQLTPRFELFNAPNRRDLQLPESFVDRVTFGQSLAAYSPRQVQLAARFVLFLRLEPEAPDMTGDRRADFGAYLPPVSLASSSLSQLRTTMMPAGACFESAVAPSLIIMKRPSDDTSYTRVPSAVYIRASKSV